MSDKAVFTEERRAYPRLPVGLPIKVASYKEDQPLSQALFLVRECYNLSAGGMSYFTESPPTNGQIVIALPGSPAPRYMLAHVRNVRRVADARYFISCQFIRQLNSPSV